MKKPKIFKSYKHFISTFLSGFSRILKYQIITALLFAVVLLPLFYLALNMVKTSKGAFVSTSGLISKLFLNPQGIFLIVIFCILVLMGILLEICGFINISAQIIHKNEESSYKELLKSNFKHLPKMFGFGGLILIAYILIVIPLTGAGPNISFLEKLELPELIDKAVGTNGMLANILPFLSGILLLVSILWMFTFQFMVIDDLHPIDAMKKSSKLIRRNLKRFLKELIGISTITSMLAGFISIIWVIFIYILSSTLNLDSNFSRALIMFLYFIQSIALALSAFLVIPFEIHHFTLLFYELMEIDEEFKDLSEKCPNIPKKIKESRMDKIFSKKKTLITLCILGMTILSSLIGIYVKDVFKPEVKTTHVEIIAYGGEEKSKEFKNISDIQKAIKDGANWVQIGIEKEKDGGFILGEAAEASHTKPTTLEDALKVSKNKIKIVIELNDKTTDEKSLKELDQIIKEANMSNSVILVSSNYTAIESIKKDNPAQLTGYEYSKVLGNLEALKADYLILESEEAKEETIKEIHNDDKKVIISDANLLIDMPKIVDLNVEAFLSDNVEEAKAKVTEAYAPKTIKDVILKEFFGSLFQ